MTGAGVTGTGLTGIVLAGGSGRRFGSDKRTAAVAGTPLLLRVLERIQPFCTDLIVVTRSDDPIPLPLPPAVRAVSDDQPGAGPLAALCTGLAAAREPWSLALAGDHPFLAPAVLTWLLAQREGTDAVVPVVSGIPQVLHALYHQRCRAPFAAAASAGRFTLYQALGDVNVRRVPEGALRSMDPDLRSFFNVNTPRDLRRAESIAAAERIEPPRP